MEIKFRAWDTEAKCMIDWSYLCTMMETGRIQLLERESIKKDWPSATVKSFSRTGNPFKNPKFILMQYTGLNDKKRTKEYPEGQEIYEGDIVKADNWEFFVIWQKYGWGLKGLKSGWWRQFDEFDSKEIIGNRFEHPELLEKKD